MNDQAATVAQHTPGPWRSGAWAAYTDHAVVVIDQHDEQVATTTDLLKPWEECEANARLIAAAPDMLAMLKRIYEWDHLTPFGAELQALIAKAEGR